MLTNKNKFTLIELLLVISIFFILITLLQPSLSKVQASSQSIQCSTLLKSSMIGAAYYDEDHQWLPAPILEMNENNPSRPNWDTLWYNLLKDLGYTGGQNPRTGCPTERLHQTPSSYSINLMDLLSSSVNKKMYPIREAAVGYQISLSSSGTGSPDKLLFFADHQAKESGFMHQAIRTSYEFWDGTHSLTGPPDFRHLGLKNVVFVDGHVAAHGPGEFENGHFLRD